MYVPGIDPQPIDISNIEINPNTTGSPRFIFLKFDSMVEGKQAIAVNNSMLLEI
jgi:hypothetical protein